MSFKTNIKEFWADPQKRSIIVWASALIGCYFLVPVFFAEDKKIDKPISQTDSTSFFSVEDVQAMEERKSKELFDQLAAEQQNRDVAAASREQRLAKQEEKLNQEIMQIRNDRQEMKRMLAQFKEEFASRKTLPAQAGPDKTQTGKVIRHDQNAVQIVETPQTQVITREPLVKGTMLRTVTQGKVRSVKTTGHIEEQKVQMLTVSEDTQQVDNKGEVNKQATKANVKEEKDNGHAWLSAGAIITGTTINGVHAPTASGQQSKMPMPVLIRVKKEAIMPNNFSLDIRECNILGTAIGDLATSRAFVRSETISCITESGKAIEVPMTAYAVGRDGVNGIAGQLVSKAGGLMQNAMGAGFLSGLSKAATPSSINVLNTNPGDKTQFQSANLKALGESAVLNGASTSFDMIAKYYLELVDASWPVVEVLGGREIDFILQKGVSLQIKQ